MDRKTLESYFESYGFLCISTRKGITANMPIFEGTHNICVTARHNTLTFINTYTGARKKQWIEGKDNDYVVLLLERWFKELL